MTDSMARLPHRATKKSQEPRPHVGQGETASNPLDPRPLNDASHARYRPDIDGLRAIAVSSVIAFHAGIPGVDGGFAGVDIFFVISGFLITGILIREIERGEFSFARFYERRIRRIFPALFMMMIIIAVPAWLLLIPPSFQAFGISAAAAALSASNFYFWTQSNYFGVDAAQLPLLHTWSLAIEEQFYLFLPPYLLLMKRWTNWRWTMLLLPVILTSFALGVYQTSRGPSAAFYFPVTRMWELGLGGLFAAFPSFPTIAHGHKLREITAAIGLALIAWATFTFTEKTRFPGTAALIPCLGAALIIYANQGYRTYVGALLSWKPLVFIGLISYSLYLWHWPVLVFSRMMLAEPPTGGDKAMMLVAIVLVSIASWRLVERPFRRAPKGASRRPLFAAAAAIMIVFAGFGMFAFQSVGAPWRFSAETRQLADAATDINPYRKQCDRPDMGRVLHGGVCVLGKPGTRATVAIFGDSYADALMPGFVEAATQSNAAIAVYSRSGCRPLVGVGKNKKCTRQLFAMAAAVARDPSIHTVVLVGRWPEMLSGWRRGAVNQFDGYLTDDLTPVGSEKDNPRVFERAITRTITSFGNKRVFVVAHMPEQRIIVPQTAVARTILNLPPPDGVRRGEFEERERSSRAALATAKKRLGFTILDLSTAACNELNCRVLKDGHALYFDDNHPNQVGARQFVPLFGSVFALP